MLPRLRRRAPSWVLCVGFAWTAGGGIASAVSSPLGTPPPATIAVSPAFPSSADAITLAIRGDVGQCWPASLDWDPPVVLGPTILLQAHTPLGPLPPSCTYPWPQRFSLGPLPAGAWSAEFRLDQQIVGAQAFDVATPVADLGLAGERFRASARFTDPTTGDERPAAAVQLGDDSGYFWFFASDNVELTIKLLDGRGVNGHFWVFIASMTDVAIAVDVTDTAIVCIRAPCGTRTYSAAAGHNTNFLDTQAF